MSAWIDEPVLAVQPLCWRRVPVPREQRRYDFRGRCVGEDRIEVLLEYQGEPIVGQKFTGLQVLPFPHGPTYVDGEMLRFVASERQVWVAETELTRQAITVLSSPPALEEFGF